MEKNKIDIKYTLCFIKRDNEFLMLNRIKAPNMGLWNGVGGKLELNEDKFQGIKREITEETGLFIEEVKYHGEVYWYSKHSTGGMYVFTAEFPENNNFKSPVDDIEGLLAFRTKDWLFHKENKGVISNIPIFLEKMMKTNDKLRFDFYYDENENIKNYTFQNLSVNREYQHTLV